MRLDRSVAAGLLVVQLAGLAWASDEFDARAIRVATELSSPDAAVRASAVHAFASLGVEAIEPALRALSDPEEGTPEFDSVLAALKEIGIERSAATIRSLRSIWPAGADELMDAVQRLRAERLGSHVTFERGTLEDPNIVPPTLELPLRDGAFPLPGGPAVKVDGKSIRVDEEGDGRFARRVKAQGDVVTGPTGKSFFIYDDFGRWCAAPAETWRAKFAKTGVEILDTDADGVLTERVDWIRWGNGAFLPLRNGDLVQLKDGLHRYRIATREETPTLEVVPEPETRGLDPRHERVLARLNDWRRRTGLPALYWDVARSRACQAHCRYWSLNGYSAHVEDSSKPGYTRAGARAGRLGSCPAKGDVEAILSFHYMILHRVTPTGDAGRGLGVGVGPGLCAWVDWPSAGGLGTPILVPAPGQTGVPHTGYPEDPPPARDPSFYAKKRGYAISVERSGLTVVSDVRLTVFRVGRKPTQVAGELFSRESPYRENSNTTLTHFVPNGPLSRGWHVAKFEGRKKDGEVVTLVWTFEVGGR